MSSPIFASPSSSTELSSEDSASESSLLSDDAFFATALRAGFLFDLRVSDSESEEDSSDEEEDDDAFFATALRADFPFDLRVSGSDSEDDSEDEESAFASDDSSDEDAALAGIALSFLSFLAGFALSDDFDEDFPGAALTCAAFGFSSSEELSELSSDEDAVLAGIALG